jgi:hypothetical protein
MILNLLGNGKELLIWVFGNNQFESFIDKVAQQYAGEVIIGESEKSAFNQLYNKMLMDQIH